ncbi:neither inactivation nor afterpotential protein C-like isoform X2 [Eriocheir sinensis]|uniref:neither inactivation nor afterpotential protein C-like isoform X2 n=1 Tax=Eriocheir sinensis TaxID=95602 RepID=UPI0021C7D3B0|nr:neither inactivation nor afterpotential protein C-like isoform X2 [Eriocheir sinensis]
MAYDGLGKHLDFRSLPEPGDRFELKRVIATGTYGEVHEATDKENDNRRVAVKVVENIKESMEEVEEEHRVLAELSLHDNFPEFYGTFLKRAGDPENHQIWFVMEYITLGTAADLAKAYKANNQRMPEALIGYILKNVITAVQHLHQAHVMYRDVKGMNILITEEGNIKLVDFGQCGHLDSTMGKRRTAVGTPYWMAPEVVECEQKPDVEYDNRCDVWALGITAIELGDGHPPNADVHPVRALFQIVRNPPPTLKRFSDWTQDFNDFIGECLVKTPDHRPIMMELMEHPFIASVPEDPGEVKKQLVSEHKRLFTPDLQRERPLTGIARHGYLKTKRRGVPKRMITDDLASLEVFNDEIVMDTMYSRWKEGKIYTWVADVLLAVNPFSMKAKYDEETQVKYKSKTRSQNDPHVFAIADRAHQDMMHHKEHQTIVLAGESGSGKTFSFHQIVNQLCHIGMSNPGLITKIQRVNVVLDAFGNAVTQLNTDSTRHVRYFDLTFSKTGKVSGAIVWLMMLDKYRVTERGRNEGNFHIFYYLYDGLSQSSRLSRYGLKLGRKYHYLAKHPYDNEVSNAQKFLKVEEAFKEIGLTDRELHTIYLVLASILILGNIDFKGDHEAAIVDKEPVAEVCRLLDIEEKKLCWALCNYVKVKPDLNVEQAKKTQEEAELSRDAFARTLYARIMDFMVNVINVKLSVTRLVFGDPFAIGILDMFGFEANDFNTLENLLVNVANEQVQYFYNQYIFSWEMQDYSEEGIPVKSFTFPDNRHILELFLGKNSGFFSVLEDESRDEGGSDASLSCKLKERANNKQMQAVSDYTFAIAHYVGRVKYDIHCFVEKNRDHISAELVQTMRKSANEHLREMFCNKLTKTGNLTTEVVDVKKMKGGGGGGGGGLGAADKKKGSRRFNTKSKGRMSQTRQLQTLGMNFRYSLIELLYKLTNSQPHFVRCFRSNMDNSGTVFDRDMIKHQIKYHAVCDTIAIRQQGFSHRIPYQEFLRRYQFLAFEFDEQVDMTKDNARLLLVRLKMEGWAIGKDKVFLKYYNEEFLCKLYETSVKKIVKIQALMRAYMMRTKAKLKDQIKKKDENFRGFKTRQENPEMAKKIRDRRRFGEATVEGEAARYVQHYYRRWKMRTLFQQLQIYRADKQQQLIYFSQQVHLYGQEIQAKQQRHSQRMDLGHVRNEAPGTHNKILKRERGPAPKLALDHMINAYFDTTYLCDPSRAKKGRQQDDDWEAPFKSRAATSRAQNMGITDEERAAGGGGGGGGGMGARRDFGASGHTPMDVRSRTAMFDQGINNENSSSYNYKPPGGAGSAYNKFAGSSSANKPAASYNRFAGSNVSKPAYTNLPTPSYLKPTPAPSVPVSSWSDRQQNGYSNQGDEEEQGTHDFRKHLRKTNVRSDPLREMTERAGATGEGVFNFQGMLRKTGHNRQSMKRGEGDYGGDPYMDQANGSDLMCQSPTLYEETEEAML